MALDQQQLIASLGLRLYADLVEVLQELEEVRKGNKTLTSITVDPVVGITPEAMLQIEALFKQSE